MLSCKRETASTATTGLLIMFSLPANCFNGLKYSINSQLHNKHILQCSDNECKNNSFLCCINWKWEHLLNIFPQAGCPWVLEALIAHITWSPQFGITTGWNWAPNRQPLGRNGSTASSNKAAISTAHRQTASQFGCKKHNNISLLWERRFCPLHAAYKEGDSNILAIIKTFVSLGGEKLEILVSLQVYTLGHCLFRGGNSFRPWGWRVESFKTARR